MIRQSTTANPDGLTVAYGTRAVPQVSVVVMTCNRPGSLRRCLASLAGQTMAKDAFEVVVVDVSSPGVGLVVGEFSQSLAIIHLPAMNRGVAANRNAGARVARGQVLAFLDDDCIASSRWLEVLVNAVNGGSRILAGCNAVHPQPDTATAAAGQVISEMVYGFYNPANASSRFLPGLNFALLRESYLALGGCDEHFGFLAAEDRDFVDRWRHAGGCLALRAEADVRHEHRSTLRGFIRQYFNYGRGAWRYHQLRRQRQRGGMWEDARLHTGLLSRLIQPMRKVSLRYQLPVILLIGAWQLANLAGFVWQAVADIPGGRISK